MERLNWGMPREVAAGFSTALNIPAVNIADFNFRVRTKSERLNWNIALNAEQVAGNTMQFRLHRDPINNSPRSGEAKLALVIKAWHIIPTNSAAFHYIEINLSPTNNPLDLGNGVQLRLQYDAVRLCK